VNVLSVCLTISLISIGAAGQLPVDLIVINANVRTLEKSKPRAQAIAIANGRIVAVGSDPAIKAMSHPGTKVIDAGGRLVIPGFNDAHVHFAGIGNSFSHLDLRSEKNVAAVFDRIAEYSSILPKGRWLRGSGCHADSVPPLDQLDAVSPDNPLFIYLADPALALVNSAAIRKIKGTSPNAVPHKHIKAGVVAGPALTLVRNAIPKDYFSNVSEIAETASNYAASLGVTSVQDMHSDDLTSALRALSKAGRLKTRVYECVWISDRNKLAQAGIKAATGDPMVRTGCVKSMSLGTPDEIPELRRSFAEADKAGLQIMVHAIGERAISNAVNAFEYAALQNGTRDRRFRIEHAYGMTPELIPRLFRSAMIPSMQPYLFYRGDGGESDDYRSLVRSGVRLAFGSDASITDLNPLLGIHAAVNAAPDGSISVEDAVNAYTLGSAFAEFQEKEKGTLQVGKLADFVILSEDIFVIDRKKISGVKVLTTVTDGKVVYDAAIK
jgi:predicted amidohydrolase YtcJ